MLNSESGVSGVLDSSTSPVGSRSFGPMLRRWAAPALLLVAAAAALGIDCPLARWCADGKIPGDLVRVVTWAECFGHGLGVLLIVLAIYQLDPPRRWMLPRVLAVSLGAGLAANVVKMCVARSRPREFDCSLGVLESFRGWFSLGAGGSGAQSFPSAHTATAVGLALALAWLYPRGRWLFAALAVLAAFQRLQSSAHFLSDTLVGASLGWMVAMILLPGGIGAGRFDRLEAGRTSEDGLAPSGGRACRSG